MTLELPTQLVLLSGGMDSATALAWSGTRARLALSVDYGQRHSRELQAARAIAHYYDVPHVILDMTGWGRLLSGSSLIDFSVPVPLGHYEDESMKATVVPNRNATMLMAAVGVAASRGIDQVVAAVHAGDHAIYPDCRPEFILHANRTARSGTDGAVEIVAPFVNIPKEQIALLGSRLGVPYVMTWSCYQGGTVHCGECGTCVERREAFQIAQVADPTVYAQGVAA